MLARQTRVTPPALEHLSASGRGQLSNHAYCTTTSPRLCSIHPCPRTSSLQKTPHQWTLAGLGQCSATPPSLSLTETLAAKLLPTLRTVATSATTRAVEPTLYTWNVSSVSVLTQSRNGASTRSHSASGSQRIPRWNTLKHMIFRSAARLVN